MNSLGEDRRLVLEYWPKLQTSAQKPRQMLL